ncbi:MAG: ABC transporter permease [Bacteroidota bacterium]
MLKHHLLIALRSFNRQRGYTALNVAGLAVGLAAAFFVMLGVEYERSVDAFQSDRLYMARQHVSFDEGQTIQTWSATPQPLAEALETDVPQVERAAMVRFGGENVLASGSTPLLAEGIWADDDFFEIMAFPVLAGSAPTALARPDAIVLTEGLAQRLLGATPTEALGQTVRFDNRHDATVTAVVADVPRTSSLEFEWVLPAEEFYARNEWVLSWDNNAMFLFASLAPGADVEAINAQIAGLRQVNSGFENSTLFLDPFRENYLYGEYENGVQTGGRILYVQIFTVIAVLVLLIAGVNFTNLSTARATRRATEIGVRKTMGATRASLVRQFLGEAVLLALAAFVLATLIVVACLGGFNRIAGTEVVLADIGLGAVGLGLLVAIGVGLLAGAYPAIVLSGFSPSRSVREDRMSGLALRRGLVVAQFAASVVLITGTFAVAGQMQYIQNRDIGLEREDVITMQLQGGALDQFDAFQSEVLASPAISAVSVADNNPLSIGSSTEAPEWSGGQDVSDEVFFVLAVHYDFVETMGMEMNAGRAFSRESIADSSNFLLNEAAVRALGMTEAVGESITFWGETGQVVGVVEDFHMQTVHSSVKPTILYLDPDPSGWQRLFVRAEPGQTAAALSHLRSVSTTFSPEYPFATRFLDEEFDTYYESERQFGALAGVFAAVAAFIAGLGLLGLAAYAAEQRRKEVGVRRVLGASLASVVGLLTRDFLAWVGLACLVAVPVAYLIAEEWLNQFEYRISLGAGPFLSAAVAALVVAVLAAGTQAMRAALADPVHALRSE